MKAQRLHLEFASQDRRWRLPGLLAVVAAALLLGWVGLQVFDTLSERISQQKALQEMATSNNTPKTRSQAIEKPDPKDVAKASFARQTVRSLNTPWADLLDGLEKAPNNVAVLVLEPSAAKRSLSITAEAASHKEMLDYLAALQSDARFSNVSLMSHQLQVQAPGTPMRFQLRATWGESP